MKRAYLGLGTNLGDRAANLVRAAELLASNPRLSLVRSSPVYETEPRDVLDQPWFLNSVLEVDTSLFPMQLLGHAAAVEREMGRVRRGDKGPRVIDIDVLLYGNFAVRSPRLEIPHPRMLERRFVLAPLADLAPDLRHPLTRRPIREHLAQVQGQTARRISGT
jgi:2-amino-4-hydroxy-6-hydroxymethyldihydropteridine diphosphokinase